MFGMLNTTQIYGAQTTTHEPTPPINTTTHQSTNNNHIHNNKPNKFYQQPRPRSTSSLSDSVRENKFFSSLSSMHAGIKSPTNIIEKFLKNELLNSYDSLKNYKNLQNQQSSSAIHHNSINNKNISSNRNSYSEGILNNFNCLQGSYRSNSDSEFYEAVNVIAATTKRQKNISTSTSTIDTEMTIKCSKNLLAEPPQVQAPATLQNYQKLPDYDQHSYMATPEVSQMPSSGASSGEFNGDLTGTITALTSSSSSSSSAGNSFYKRLSFGGNRSGSNSNNNHNTNSKHLDVVAHSQANESASDNSSSSITTTVTTNSSTSTTTTKSNDLHRSSSASSSGDCVKTARERKCKSLNMQDLTPTNNGAVNASSTPERAQRRKLLQMISNYEQQNKQLQRELVKEKRRRTEELSRVVKSLLCFESKLKTDMKTVNQRLADKDNEICRLVRLNRALRKKVADMQRSEKEKICDEGVVVGDGDGDGEADDVNSDKHRQEDILEDCLVLEALQCNNCRKQFYDIELKEGCTQTSFKDGSRKNADHNLGHDSSSDETVSSSFCGARRSVRYTSKRTSGTFRDYMRSRCMNIDDPSLEQNSEENTSTVSRDDSNASYEKLNVYSRTIERMHGVKCESEQESSEHSGIDMRTPVNRGNRVNSRCSSKASDKSDEAALEEDDGIFSPTQDDDDFEEEQQSEPTATKNRALKIVPRRAPEFSEASPKQIYETSTDDWYASASDQEEIVAVAAKNSYLNQGAVNPVLECVNQILLQQSMDETGERPSDLTAKPPQQLTPTNLPRRSSLSGRRNSRGNDNGNSNSPRNGTLTRKRVHFSTKNSMVHVPRNDEVDDEEDDDNGLQIKIDSPSYHSMHGYHQSSVSNVIATEATVEAFNYESIYSNGNEYEPVGSERNSSNLYVDMESAAKLLDPRPAKKPPALPPKPANLIKFKKCLQQLDEVPDEQQDCETVVSAATSEPDYCSISEVNGITSVQIVAVVHKPPESVTAEDDLEAPVSELDLEVSTVASDETCGAISQKTDEIEEIFADIPKLPNVAAIIAPKKHDKKHHHSHHPHQQQHQMQQSNNDYLIMSPKVETPTIKTQNARRLALNLSSVTTSLPHELLGAAIKSPKVENASFQLQLQLGTPPQHLQYKRKSMPNILAEINQRLSLPTTPTTPTAMMPAPSTPAKVKQHYSAKKQFEEATKIPDDLPLQAEFDWYNLDAEYGRSTPISSTGSALNQPDLLKVSDHHNNGMLADIREDHESVTTAADEYNLDEEFSLTSDQQQQPDILCEKTPELEEPEAEDTNNDSLNAEIVEGKAEAASDIGPICEALNFPLYNENSPAAPAKAKKMKKNLANFEKFIEGSGLSTKPLPSKRKIYFAGPYV